MLKQMGERSTRKFQYPRSLTSVEKIDDVKTKVVLKPLNIHISTMQDFNDGRISKGRI